MKYDKHLRLVSLDDEVLYLPAMLCEWFGRFEVSIVHCEEIV